MVQSRLGFSGLSTDHQWIHPWERAGKLRLPPPSQVGGAAHLLVFDSLVKFIKLLVLAPDPRQLGAVLSLRGHNRGPHGIQQLLENEVCMLRQQIQTREERRIEEIAIRGWSLLPGGDRQHRQGGPRICRGGRLCWSLHLSAGVGAVFFFVCWLGWCHQREKMDWQEQPQYLCTFYLGTSDMCCLHP